MEKWIRNEQKAMHDVVHSEYIYVGKNEQEATSITHAINWGFLIETNGYDDTDTDQ